MDLWTGELGVLLRSKKFSAFKLVQIYLQILRRAGGRCSAEGRPKN